MKIKAQYFRAGQELRSPWSTRHMTEKKLHEFAEMVSRLTADDEKFIFDIDRGPTKNPETMVITAFTIVRHIR